MTPFEIAKSYLGTHEVAGKKDNPTIMSFYKAVGQDWVEHDETAWCAAFVGACLEKAGIRSTRKLNARSYETWGKKVDLANAQEGDVVVFKRGNKAWQGHVAFFVKREGTRVEVLGGNQRDSVSTVAYPASRIVAVRRAFSTPADQPKAVYGQANDLPSVREVQERLIALGYHEVGNVDGKMGTKTRGAILAFRADNGLDLSPDIDTALAEALKAAPPREIAPERAKGKPKGSRILTSANAQIAGGTVGAVGVAAGAVTDSVGKAEQAKDVAGRALDLLNLGDLVAPFLPWIGAAIFIGVVFFALRARRARIADYQTGKTP